MEAQLSSVTFALTTFFLMKYEVKRYKNFITPYTVTVIPLVLISLSVNFISVAFGGRPVTMRVNLFLMFVTTLILLSGIVVTKPQENYSLQNNFIEYFSRYESYKNIFIVFSFLVFFLVFSKVRSLVAANGGWEYLASSEFEEKMSSGFIAYLIVFSEAALIFLFLITRKSKNKIVINLALFLYMVSIFMIMVKYNLLWVIMIMFFINNFYKSVKRQFFQSGKIFIALTIIFMVFFIFLTIFWGTFSFTKIRIWEFIYKMFFSYLFGGPVLLDSWLNTPSVKPDWTLFTVFLNTMNVFSGNPDRINMIPLLSNGFETILPGMKGNVGTSFGVYYLIGGMPFTLFMTILFASISYIVYSKALNGPNAINLFLMIFLLTINALNFFVQYFTLLTFYLLPVFFVLLVGIFSFHQKLKMTRNMV